MPVGGSKLCNTHHTWPTETAAEVLDRVLAEHGAEVYAIVAAEMTDDAAEPAE